MKKRILLAGLLLFLSAGCNPFSQTIPVGIVKTVNGGSDWQFANKYKDNPNLSLDTLSVSKLAFDPGNSQTVFAGTYNNGLFKSEDAAGSWVKILSNIFVYDFVLHPQDAKTIYAAGFFADHGRVLKTTDGGGSWNQIYNEESLNNAVRGIAINPTNPSQIVIGLASGSVIKSADGGLSWQLATNFSDQVNRVLWQNGKIYVLVKTKGLYESADFGQSFKDITASLSKTYNLGSLYYTESTIDSFSQVFVDLTAPSLIYLTTNKGLQKTTDGGLNWTRVALPIKPDPTQGRAVAISRASSNIVYTSIGSTIYKSLDGGLSWQTQSISSGGFINYILIDPQLAQIVYAGIYANQ